MKTQLTAIALLVAALALQAVEDVHLLPSGEFSGRDGRPGKGLTWKLSNEKGRALAAKLNERHAKTAFQLDYEHQAMLAEENGLPAPASGWAKTFEWRDDDGLYATKVEWTARAKALIEGDEYRYISPVIVYDKKTGEVVDVINASLVGIPNLLDLNPVAQERMSRLNASFSTQEQSMNPVLKALLKALGLADDATEAQATAALASLQAARSDLTALLKSLGVADTTTVADATTAIATLRTKATATGEPDPTKWVSLDRFTELNNQVSKLSAGQADRDVEELLKEAQAAGKCSGVVVDVWRDVGKKDIAQLRALIDKTPAIAALASRQTDGRRDELPKDVASLTTEQKAMCKQLGLKPDDYLATLKEQAEEQAAA